MIPKSGNRFPACAKPWHGPSFGSMLRRAKAGRKRSCANERGQRPMNDVRVAPQGGSQEAGKDNVSAAILVIGDESLSGRTKDKNIGYIAEYLTNIGVDVKEVRVVADVEGEIIAAL